MRVTEQQALTRSRARGPWRARVATATLAGALAALAGCSLIAELADQSFHQPVDAGTTMFSDATTDAGHDGSPAGDAMVPPTPGVFVAPPCVASDAGGWQLDCTFGDGGFIILPNVHAGSQPPVVSVNPSSPAALVLAGVLADDRTSFVVVVSQGMVDEDYGIAEIATTGAPAGVSAVPGGTGNAYAALVTNAIADAGDGGGSGAQGVGFVVVFENDAGSLQQTVFDPSGAGLTAFDFADFDQERFEGLLIANRTVGLSAQPALIRINLDPSGGGSQFTYVDTREGADVYYPATSASLGFLGGFIGTSQSGAGTLYQFDDAGIVSGTPVEKVHSSVLAFNGGIGTFGNDLGTTGVIGLGIGVDGITAQFFVPPFAAGTQKLDYASAGSAPPGISPDAVRYVHGILSNFTRYGVAVKSEVETKTSFVSIARFDVLQESVRFEPTSADGGLFSIEFASPMKLGTAFYYLGDICMSLLIENSGAPNAPAIACFKTNGQVTADSDSGAKTDAGTGAGDD